MFDSFQKLFVIPMGAYMMAADASMDCCKVHVIVEEHGHAKVNSFLVDFLLCLPIRIGFTEWCPVQIFNSLVLLPKVLDWRTGSCKGADVLRREEALLQDRQNDVEQNRFGCVCL